MRPAVKAHEQRRLGRQRRIAALEREINERVAGRRIEPSQPAISCSTCGRPVQIYDGHTASSATYHGDGTRTVNAWHLPDCYPGAA